MKRLFVIHTPYQLIATVNIINSDHSYENILLLVQPNLSQFVDIYKSLNNTRVYTERNLFIFYKNKDKRFFTHIKMVVDIFKKKRIISSLSFLSPDISQLFIPSEDIICRIIFYQLNKISVLSQVILYDDGLGTYTMSTFKHISFLGKIVYNMLLNGNLVNQIKMIYCYQPSLIAESANQIKICKIPILKSTTDLFKDFAKEKVTPYKDKEIIFFDQGFSHMPEIRKCLSIIKHTYSYDKVIFKKHPRIHSGEGLEFIQINDGLPFEAILPNLNLERIMLVSHSSGACFTPYLMSEKKPYIVLLYKIANKGEVASIVDNFFLKLQNSIPDNNIYIPNNIEEFQQIVNDFRNKINN